MDESPTFSPTLLYVLGHELSHVVLGHVASHLSGAPLSKGASSALEAALDACSDIEETVKQEEEADILSLGIVKGEIHARGERSQRLFDGFKSIYSWTLWTPGQAATFARGGASFCSYVGTPAPQEAPSYRDGHPRIAARLARIAAATDRSDAFLLRIDAEGDEEIVRHFCDQAHQYEAHQLDCDDAPRSPGLVALSDGTPVVIITNEPRAVRIETEPKGDPVLTDTLIAPLCEQGLAACSTGRAALARCSAGAGAACQKLAEDVAKASGDVGRETTLSHFACLHGNAQACVDLAALLEDADRPDVVSARKWALRGCRMGSSNACMQAAEVLQKMNEPRPFTLGLWRRACELGASEGCDRDRELSRIVGDLRRTTDLPFAFQTTGEIPTL